MHASAQPFGHFPLHSRSKYKQLQPLSNRSEQRRQHAMSKQTKIPRCSCVAEAPSQPPVKPPNRRTQHCAQKKLAAYAKSLAAKGTFFSSNVLMSQSLSLCTRNIHNIALLFFTQAKSRRLCRNSIKGCSSGLKMATWPCLLPTLKLSKDALIMPGRCTLLLQHMLSAP